MNKKNKDKPKTNYDNIREALVLLYGHSIFHIAIQRIEIKGNGKPKGEIPSTVGPDGVIFLNADTKEFYSPAEWCYIAAHQYMHLVFGHFDAEKISGRNISLEEQGFKLDSKAWNLACDLYVANFLNKMKVGQMPFSVEIFQVGDADEKKLYDILVNNGLGAEKRRSIETISSVVRMDNIFPGIVYEKDSKNPYTGYFGKMLSRAVRSALSDENVPSKDSRVSKDTNP